MKNSYAHVSRVTEYARSLVASERATSRPAGPCTFKLKLLQMFQLKIFKNTWEFNDTVNY